MVVGTLLAFVLTALLGITLFYGSSYTIASRSQDVGQSDVQKKLKDSPPTQASLTAAAPANDNCANAITIESCPFTDTRDTTGATNETGEPPSPCTTQGKSVWYTLPASVNRRLVTVDTCGSSYDQGRHSYISALRRGSESALQV